MSIPTYEILMMPILKLMSDGTIRRRPEIISEMETLFSLSEKDRAATVSSGGRVIAGRCNWAVTYLHKAEYLVIPSRGNIRITDSGREIAASNISSISKETLSGMSPTFKVWRDQCREAIRRRRDEKKDGIGEVTFEAPDTPDEMLASALTSIREKVASETYEQITICSPSFFEKLVVDVLKAMGYGGGFEGSASVTQYTQDGGIDGIIKEDKLGLDTVYVQAKRQEANVGRPAIQAFVGAMQGKGVRKGVFVTTSSFTNDAKEYVKTVESRVVLVDGRLLSELMVDHNVGCSTTQTFHIKKLDTDYFEELE